MEKRCDKRGLKFLILMEVYNCVAFDVKRIRDRVG